MAEYTQINANKTKGAKVATDEINGIVHQRIKNQFGGDGTATEVTYETPFPVGLPEMSSDAFGRIRTSAPLTEFEVQHEYNIQPLIWDDSTSGGGEITHDPDAATVIMSTGDGVAGSGVTRTTKRYFRYLPGKSHQINETFVMGVGVANLVRRVGYYDDNDGFFFEQIGTNLYFTLRSSATGSPVDTRVIQSNWSHDPLNGNGPSGITLDISKVQILHIDFQWLGAGRVRWGFNVNGKTILCHESLHANVIDNVYVRSANLPLRYEIINSSTTGVASTLKQICSAVISEGGIEKAGFRRSINNAASPKAVTTRRPLLSIRRKALFNSLPNNALILPVNFSVFSANESILYELVLGGTLNTPSWVDLGTDSLVEYDLTASTITGGQVIDSGYVSASGSGSKITSGVGGGLLSKENLSGSDILTVVATSLSGSSSNCYGSLNWEEIY